METCKTPPPAALTTKALEDYVASCATTIGQEAAEKAAADYVSKELGVDPSLLMKGGKPSWQGAAQAALAAEGINASGWFDENGEPEWMQISQSVAALAGGAACTAVGAAVLAPLCSAAAAFIVTEIGGAIESIFSTQPGAAAQMVATWRMSPAAMMNAAGRFMNDDWPGAMVSKTKPFEAYWIARMATLQMVETIAASAKMYAQSTGQTTSWREMFDAYQKNGLGFNESWFYLLSNDIYESVSEETGARTIVMGGGALASATWRLGKHDETAYGLTEYDDGTTDTEAHALGRRFHEEARLSDFKDKWSQKAISFYYERGEMWLFPGTTDETRQSYPCEWMAGQLLSSKFAKEPTQNLKYAVGFWVQTNAATSYLFDDGGSTEGLDVIRGNVGTSPCMSSRPAALTIVDSADFRLVTKTCWFATPTRVRDGAVNTEQKPVCTAIWTERIPNIVWSSHGFVLDVPDDYWNCWSEWGGQQFVEKCDLPKYGWGEVPEYSFVQEHFFSFTGKDAPDVGRYWTPQYRPNLAESFVKERWNPDKLDRLTVLVDEGLWSTCLLLPDMVRQMAEEMLLRLDEGLGKFRQGLRAHRREMAAKYGGWENLPGRTSPAQVLEQGPQTEPGDPSGSEDEQDHGPKRKSRAGVILGAALVVGAGAWALSRPS